MGGALGGKSHFDREPRSEMWELESNGFTINRHSGPGSTPGDSDIRIFMDSHRGIEAFTSERVRHCCAEL